MKKLFITLLVILGPWIMRSQESKDAYGTPVIVFTETNPCLMVAGADAPTFVMYANGLIIYKKIVDQKEKYYQVPLTIAEAQNVIFALGITEKLMKLPGYIEATDWNDQPTNELILNFDSEKVTRIYGDLRSKRREIKNHVPLAFYTIFDNIIHFTHPKAKEWVPDKIEVILTNFNHSPKKPFLWPKEWPDLKNEETVKRGKHFYSIYLNKSDYKTFSTLLDNLDEKQAVKINGKKFAVTYRFPIPNVR